jgi:hypothetical protein
MLQFPGPGPRAESRPPMLGSGLAVMPSLREDYMAHFVFRNLQTCIKDDFTVESSKTVCWIGIVLTPIRILLSILMPIQIFHMLENSIFFLFFTAAPVYIVLSFSSVS